MGTCFGGLEKLGVRLRCDFDRTVIIDGEIEPQVTWGTSVGRAGLRVDS